MGATKTFAPFGIFCEGGAFFSLASAVETEAAIRSTRMFTTFALYDICHSLLQSIIGSANGSTTPPRLLKHNLLDVFGACLSCALPAAHRVGLVDGIAEDDGPGLQVRNLDAGLLI